MPATEAAIVTRLKATAAVTALVGTRIWPHEARQGAARPYLVYYAETNPEYHMGGELGLDQCEMTIEVHTEGNEQYRQAKQVVSAVRDCLSGYRGTINVTDGSSVEQVSIRTCLLESMADAMTPPIDGSERGRYAVFMSFSIGVLDASLGA